MAQDVSVRGTVLKSTAKQFGFKGSALVVTVQVWMCERTMTMEEEVWMCERAMTEDVRVAGMSRCDALSAGM